MNWWILAGGIVAAAMVGACLAVVCLSWLGASGRADRLAGRDER